MTVTTHQPIFLPWPGFFCKALRADAMVLLDGVQFPRGRSWMTRNRVKSDQGELWLRIPVWRRRRGRQLIRDVEICRETDWRHKHLRSLSDPYANAPYRDEHLPAVEAIYARDPVRLIELNVALIRHLRGALGIGTPLYLQSELGVEGNGTGLLVALCRRLSADAYVSLSGVEKHLDTGPFRAAGVRLEFARWDPPVYPQLWGDFRFNLSTLDLLLNCGPKAREIIDRAAGGATCRQS